MDELFSSDFVPVKEFFVILASEFSSVQRVRGKVHRTFYDIAVCNDVDHRAAADKVLGLVQNLFLAFAT